MTRERPTLVKRNRSTLQPVPGADPLDHRPRDVICGQKRVEIVVGNDVALLAVDDQRVFVSEFRPRIERHDILPVVGDEGPDRDVHQFAVPDDPLAAVGSRCEQGPMALSRPDRQLRRPRLETVGAIGGREHLRPWARPRVRSNDRRGDQDDARSERECETCLHIFERVEPVDPRIIAVRATSRRSADGTRQTARAAQLAESETEIID